MKLEHADIQGLLGAYALDAVPPEEAAVIESHLRECPRCRAEVDEHRETAAMLAGGGGSAPDAVWDRIAQTMEKAPPRPDEVRLRREQRSRRPGRWMWPVAAAAVAVVMVGLGFRVAELARQVDELASAQADQELAGVALDAADEPGSRLVDLRSQDGAVTVNAVVLPDGSGYLVTDNLRPLPPDRTYQLWALDGKQAISAGVLGPDPPVVAFKVAARTEALAITVEVAGGVVKTKNHPVVVAALDRA